MVPLVTTAVLVTEAVQNELGDRGPRRPSLSEQVEGITTGEEEEVSVETE